MDSLQLIMVFQLYAQLTLGNPVTEEDQWAKVRLITDIAKSVWPKDA